MMDKQNIEDCCKTNISGVITGDDLDFVLHLHRLLKREEPTPFEHSDGKQYLCTTHHYCNKVKGKHKFPYGIDNYCDNHQVIKAYLEKEN